MLRAVVQTFLSGTSTVFWKKAMSLDNSKHVRYIFAVFGMLGAVGVSLYYLLSGTVSWNELLIPSKYLLLILLIMIVTISFRPINQRIYEQERISIIMPFTNLNRIFVLIFSFFVYKDVSLVSFLITLLVIALIIAFSVDFKHFRLPKVFWSVVLVQVLVTVRFLLMGYIVLNLSDKVFYIYDSVIYFLLLVVLIAFNGTVSELRGFSGNFYANRMGASILGAFGTIIGLYLIAELGMSLTILLSFLQIAVTLGLSYFYLKDIPKKRDIVLTVLVVSLVGLGFLFR